MEAEEVLMKMGCLSSSCTVGHSSAADVVAVVDCIGSGRFGDANDDTPKSEQKPKQSEEIPLADEVIAVNDDEGGDYYVDKDCEGSMCDDDETSDDDYCDDDEDAASEDWST